MVTTPTLPLIEVVPDVTNYVSPSRIVSTLLMSVTSVSHQKLRL
jgi:hypothetical protein